MSAPDVVEKIYLQTGILQIVLMILYAMILLVLYLIFIGMNLKVSDISVTELIFLSVLNIVGIIQTYMIVGLTVVPLKEEVFILYDEASDFLWKVPVTAMLLLIGEYSSIYIFCRYKKFLMEREGVISRELGLKQLEQRFEEAQVLYGNLRSLRHDIKNHMQTIQGLSLSGEAKAYVEKLNGVIEEIDVKFSTGNTLCDVILNDKYRIARKNNIEFSVDFRYESGISDFDLGIILSNLCDNAIEACLKVQNQERRIDISYIGAGPCVLLSVSNSYDGKEIIFGENGLPLSSKNILVNTSGQSIDHGMGLKNVSVIAESYLGKVQIETSRNEFRITVMLQKRENVSPVAT
ncbi:MAG: GHKL domain-containing protein [Lachnospiraceae bacterium]|nr:GHKL domain-containing protein [Lachnospiraceae bacterium]